jgi:hypothetical protein
MSALELIGSDYGGWTVPVQLVDADWIVYGVRAGETLASISV